jgi:hypothetical protein
MSALKKAGSAVVDGTSGSGSRSGSRENSRSGSSALVVVPSKDGGGAPSGSGSGVSGSAGGGLTMFQKIKVEVALAKEYKGNTRRIPRDKLEAMYQRDPKKVAAQLNESLGLNFETLDKKMAKQHKEQERRKRPGSGGNGGGGSGNSLSRDHGDEDDDDDPYKLKAIQRRRQAVCKDAETGEAITIRSDLPDADANAARRIDNLLWRERLLMEVKEALDHPESTNERVLERALAIYRADPKNAVPQPMSKPSKLEKKGKVYAMLQVLRQTHAQQLYELVLEEEQRDKKRTQLMDWAKNDAERVAKLVQRFRDERQQWREFIAQVQHDNQMKLADVMITYGLLR